ncbi:sulfatase/phosphatase domain-containing protein [Ruficoccus amylovorans]|uniref:sulfatase/phosphatase domain-containing protein n=1 Tax=Ruficoccus amylovorans TaxID=1804625 RepID=UPI0031B5917F
MRTETDKLVTYPGHPEWTEAFDLQEDPKEKSNVIGSPEFASRREQLIERLQDELTDTGLAIPDIPR